MDSCSCLINNPLLIPAPKWLEAYPSASKKPEINEARTLSGDFNIIEGIFCWCVLSFSSNINLNSCAISLLPILI
jgi:hypothetical protein